MDFGRAYTFMTADKSWIAKVLIAAAVSAVPVLNLALYGYALEVLKRVYQGADLPMPEWDDFGNYFVRGLLVSVGLFLWQLPIIALVLITVFAGVLADTPVVWIAGLACLVPLAFIALVIVGQVVVARYALNPDFAVMFDVSGILQESRRGAGVLLLCALAYVLATIVGTVAGIVTCFIGFFFLTPWITLAQAHLLGQAYRQIREQHAAMETAF